MRVSKKQNVNPKKSFEGGATRSEQGFRFDLIPPASLRAMARRLKLGAEKHGERNWERGGETFRQATISHLFDHLQAYMDRGGQENVDAIICNAAFLCFFEERKPLRGAGRAARKARRARAK